MLVGTVKQLENEELDQRVIEAMSTEPIATLGIDGEILDRVSAQPAIRKQLDLRTMLTECGRNEELRRRWLISTARLTSCSPSRRCARRSHAAE
jgi:hypothetical protein